MNHTLRYTVQPLPTGKGFGLVDHELFDAFCTLPAGGDGKTLIPLEFPTSGAASDFLRACLKVFQFEEAPGGHHCHYCQRTSGTTALVGHIEQGSGAGVGLRACRECRARRPLTLVPLVRQPA